MATDLDSHKELIQQALRNIQFPALIDLAELMARPGVATVTEHLRFNEWLGKITGVEIDKKVDPNAGLAVFNITFESGGMEARITPQAKPIEIVEQVPSSQSPNDDITDLLPDQATPVESPPVIDTFTDLEDLVLGLDGLFKIT
jgi:hypothetical protein